MPINQTMNDGLNEHGLFIGFAGNSRPEVFANIRSQVYPEYPAISHTHAARIALESCKNVNEAVEFFRKIEIWVPDGLRHFLITDAAGNSVVLEWDLQDGRVIGFVKEGVYQVMTNTSFQIGIDAVALDCWRYRKADELLSLGVNNIEEFFNVIKEIQLNNVGGRTLWTTVADLKKKEMIVYPWEKHNEKGYTFKMNK